MPKVWLIRHGESVSNANLPTTHPAESALTPQGEEEAKTIVSAFKEAPDLIVVSPYIRAQQTAVPTQRAFPQVPIEEWPVHEFTYLHPKRYNGTTGSERGPFAQAYWERNEPHEKEGGGGESFAELMGRVQETKARLAQHPADFIAVFSHGLFLRGMIWHFLTNNTETTKESMWSYNRFVWSIRMPNCSIVEANFNEGHPLTFSGFMIDHLSNA